jgi:hypothetical protein
VRARRPIIEAVIGGLEGANRMAHEHHKKAMNRVGTHDNHYIHLLVMVALSFVAMYVLMYSMVDAYADVYHNVNQFYMAGLMAAPMLAIELLVMGAMYADKKLNALLER